MSVPRSLRGFLIVIAIIYVSFIVAAAPTVTITSPDDLSVFTSSSIDVSGAADGSNYTWYQGNKTAFDAGTPDSININSTGRVVLGHGLDDDFDDNSINTSKWDMTETGGVKVTEEGLALHINGTVSGSTASYSKSGKVVSDDPVGSFISANLVSFSGSGTGYRTHIFLLDPSSGNYAQIGQIKDASYGGLVTEWGYTISGSGWSASLGAPSSGSHVYKISYSGGKAHVYQDGVEKGSVTITLDDPVFHIIAAGKANGDKVNATWDNATSGYYSPGTLTSSVHDSRSSPPTLKYVDWSDQTSSGSGVTLEVRSSDSSTMSSPTAWTEVTKGQTAGLPTAKRYLQYRATLTSTDGSGTPTFINATILYHKAVSKVELSINGKVTWTAATGTTSWQARLSMPDGETTIWVRATDVAGDTDLTHVNVTVDTTPPVGSISIEDDELYTARPLVNLTLDATDRYGVDQMMTSDAPDFLGASWTDYAERSDWTLSGADGVKTVYAKYKDSHGLVSTVVSDSIILDTSPPVGSLLIDQGARYTNSTRLTLRLQATDISVVSSMSVSLSPSFDGATWEAYQDTMEFELTPGDGERTVYARFRDILGHVSSTVNDTIILDTRPPTVAVAINNGSLFTSSRLASVVLTVSDASPVEYMQIGEGALIDGAPIEVLRTDLTALLSAGDCRKTINARVWDAAGNMGPIGSASIILDTIPPIVNVTVAGGATYTGTRLVGVELVVIDNGVVQLMQLAEDPTFSGTAEYPFQGLTSFLLSEGDGTKTLYVRVTDAAGNVGPIGSCSIILDTTPPVMGLTINGGAAYTNRPVVTVHLTLVEHNGVEHMELTEDPSFATADHEAFRGSVTWTLSGSDGEKTLYVRSIDLAGNVGDAAIASIVLDTTPPVVGLAVNGGEGFTSSGTVELELTLTEENPNGQVEIGDRPSLADASVVQFKRAMLWELQSGDGAKTLYVRATDLGGNVGEVASASIVLDTTPPVVGIILNGGAPLTNGTTVTVELTIRETNPTGRAELDEDPTFSSAVVGPSGGSLTWALSEGDGEKVVFVRVRDLAGNTNAQTSASIILDTTPPALSIRVGGGSPFTIVREVGISLVATDANGVSEMVLGEGLVVQGATPAPFNGTAVVVLSTGDGAKTVFASVMDAAGNWCAPVTATIVLDMTPPRTTVLATHERADSVAVEVSWTGTDVTSGVRSFDVQYRDGGGQWLDLANGTNGTSIVFTGKRGHTYHFRARAADMAGNVEPFSEDPKDLARLPIEEPVRFIERTATLVVIVIVAIAIAVGVGYYLNQKRKGKEPG